MNKLIIVILAALIAAALAASKKPLTDDQKQKLRALAKECQDDPKTKTDQTLIDNALKGQWSDDQSLKENSLCFAKKIKAINEAGELNKDWLKQKWGERFEGEDLTKLEACLVQKATPQETAVELLKCQQKAVGGL